MRAGVTADDKLPQPRCGSAKATSAIHLDAPLFMAAERPRALIAASAPFGLKMSGKTERQMLSTVRRYMRNTSQPLTCHYSTCAVVGNAGALRGGNLGLAIDAHDAVFRLNAAPTLGHEGIVGRRTTWRVHNSEKPWFMASLPHAAELQVAVCHTPWIGACQHQAFSGLFSYNASIVNPVLYSQLWGLLGRPKGKQTPSTGLLAIALAIGVCDSVSLYGFSSLREASKPVRCAHHYWDCPAWSADAPYLDGGHKFHAWLEEAKLRQQWVDAGVVSDGAAAFGPGAEGADAVRRRQRELRQQQGREHALKVAKRAAKRESTSSWPPNQVAYTHVPKPPDWFEI